MADATEVYRGSGNVFADLELPDPEERLAKAMLSILVADTIKAHGWTQQQAAAVLGTTQPKVSDLVHGRLAGFSMERLYRFLNLLGLDVEITVRPKPTDRDRAHVLVHTG